MLNLKRYTIIIYMKDKEKSMEINYVNGQDVTIPKVKEAMDKLEELKSKPRSPEYTAMMDTHRKEWAEIAENAGPWEWSYGLDALVEHIKWMRDYYKLGENVWGQEDKEWKKGVKYTRLETLEKTLDYYDRWMNIENEYVQVVHTGEFKSHNNGDGTSTIDDLGFRCVYKYGPKGNSYKARRKAMKITYKKMHKAELKYKKLFYKMLYKYMESWWD